MSDSDAGVLAKKMMHGRKKTVQQTGPHYGPYVRVSKKNHVGW
jgi:hypothetical protein